MYIVYHINHFLWSNLSSTSNCCPIIHHLDLSCSSSFGSYKQSSHKTNSLHRPFCLLSIASLQWQGDTSIYHSQRGTNDGRLVDSQLNRQKGRKADSSHSYVYICACVSPRQPVFAYPSFFFSFFWSFFLSLNTLFLFKMLSSVSSILGKLVDKSKGGRLPSALSVNMGSCSAGVSVAMGLARYGWLRHGLARLASHQAYSKGQWRKRVKTDGAWTELILYITYDKFRKNEEEEKVVARSSDEEGETK